MLESIRAAVFDTHAWVWASAGDQRARAAASFRGQTILSAISLWEISMLESKGRLELLPDLDTWIEKNLAPPVELAPLSPAICVASVRLPDFHGDPADRLIVATAIVLGVPLVTADKSILDWNKSLSQLQTIALF